MLHFAASLRLFGCYGGLFQLTMGVHASNQPPFLCKRCRRHEVSVEPGWRFFLDPCLGSARKMRPCAQECQHETSKLNCQMPPKTLFQIVLIDLTASAMKMQKTEARRMSDPKFTSCEVEQNIKLQGRKRTPEHPPGHQPEFECLGPGRPGASVLYTSERHLKSGLNRRTAD